ncbi:MAG: hypothetical protein RIS29_1980 [Bacteroidota bacterium]|jgi:hypothetical protein
MTLREHLDSFYQQYNIPPEGGVHDKTFEVPLPFVKLTLPNFPWRRRMLYVHDLEHILNQQDTSWPGEIFIASWEISTGFFRNFPVIFFPLWTMGWGLWTHPKSVFNGFRKGHTDHGIATLKIGYDEILDYNLPQLQALTLNRRSGRSVVLFLIKLLFWIFVSQLIFLFPLIFVFFILFFSLR